MTLRHNGCAIVLDFHSCLQTRSLVQLWSNFPSAHCFSLRGYINQKASEEATVAWAQKVWQYIQRIVTIVVRLASDLLSWHDKYLAVVMVDWNKTGGLWDTDGSFVSVWHEGANFPLFVLPDPSEFNMFTAFKHNRWQGCSLYKAGHKNKISRSQRIWNPPVCYLVFSSSAEVDQRNSQTPICLLFILLPFVLSELISRLLSRFCLETRLACVCVWEKERDTLAVLWTIPSHPSKCAMSSNCCLIGSEMLFSGLTI